MSRPAIDPPQSQPPDQPKDLLSPVRVTPLNLSQTISSPKPQGPLKRSFSIGAQALVEQASWVEITALGLIVSTTGGSAWWNAAMAGGVVPGMVCIFIGGLGFLLLQLCSAELTSTVPFSGGSYGFTRLAFGRQFGVLVGLTETLGYSFSLVAFAALVGDSWTTGWGNPTGSLLGALGSVVLSTGIQLAGPRVFWRAVLGFGILIMVIQMAYLIICFSTGQMSLPKWAGLPHEGKENVYSLGFQGLLLSFPHGVNFYIGLESLALSAEDTKDPRTALPKGMIASAVLTMVFGIITPLVVVSSPSGLADLVDVDLPLAGVMSYTFGEAGPIVTSWLAMGSLFAGVLSNSHAVNRITFALARAGILPAWLAHTAAGVPRRVIMLNTIVQVLLILCVYLVGDTVWDIMNHASIVCGLFHYLSIFASYIYMKRKFQALPRDFVNPFGYSGAVFGIIIFAFSSGAMFAATEGVLGDLLDGSWAFVSWFILLALFSAYYMFYARFHVRMSPEEVLAVGTQVTASKMLMTGLGYSFLHEHSAREFSTENIVCWKKIETYNMNRPTFHGFEAIYEEHLCQDAAALVNVPSKHFKESQRLYEALSALIPEEQRMALRSGRRSSKDGLPEAAAALSQSFRPALMSQTSRPPLIGQNTAKQLEAAGAAVAAITDRARAAISGSQLSETARARFSQTITGADHEQEIRDLLEEVVKLLKLVQVELLMLLEKDTLPRFKASKEFAKYLEQEPLMFKEHGPAMTPSTPHSKPTNHNGRVTPSPVPSPA